MNGHTCSINIKNIFMKSHNKTAGIYKTIFPYLLYFKFVYQTSNAEYLLEVKNISNIQYGKILDTS